MGGSNTSTSFGQLIAKSGGTLVFLCLHSIRELLVQGSVHLVVVPNPVLQIPKLLCHSFWGGIFLLGVVGPVDRFQAAVDLFDSSFGAFLFQVCQGCCLCAMEQREHSLFDLTMFPLLVRSALAQEVKQRHCVFRVRNGTFKFPDCQPADPAMIKLRELLFKLFQLPLCQFEGAIFSEGFAEEQVQIGFRPSRPLSVGTPSNFHLQDTKIDSHLQHVSAVRRTHQACTHRMRFIGPILEQVIEIAVYWQHALAVQNSCGWKGRRNWSYSSRIGRRCRFFSL